MSCLHRTAQPLPLLRSRPGGFTASWSCRTHPMQNYKNFSSRQKFIIVFSLLLVNKATFSSDKIMDERVKDYERVIMGIDPGTNVLGYGVLGIRGKKPEMIVMGVVELSRFESHYLRLHRIYQRVLALVEQFLPDELAIEAPFFGKNVQSMLKLGRAQGVAMAAALCRDIPIFEYAPLSIKQAVTGRGSASKDQVAAMLKHILSIRDEDIPALRDATDALAAALAHFYASGRPALPKGPSSWEQFLKQNPDRLAKRRNKAPLGD